MKTIFSQPTQTLEEIRINRSIQHLRAALEPLQTELAYFKFSKTTYRAKIFNIHPKTNCGIPITSQTFRA